MSRQFKPFSSRVNVNLNSALLHAPINLPKSGGILIHSLVGRRGYENAKGRFSSTPSWDICYASRTSKTPPKRCRTRTWRPKSPSSSSQGWTPPATPSLGPCELSRCSYSLNQTLLCSLILMLLCFPILVCFRASTQKVSPVTPLLHQCMYSVAWLLLHCDSQSSASSLSFPCVGTLFPIFPHLLASPLSFLLPSPSSS
jgi:hypothetical protein